MAIGGASREFVLKIVADVKDAIAGVDKVGKETQSFKEKAIGIGKSVATGLAIAAVVKFGQETVNSAMEADEAMDKVESVFGSASKSVVDFSQTVADKMGLSAQDYQQMVSQTGALLQSMGINNADAAKSTEVLSQRAADLSAIYGGDAPKAMAAFDKALTGQTKGLREYGVVLSKSEIEQRAMNEGYVDSAGKVTKAGMAIAAQELILEKTSKQAGAFAENSSDLGSQQAILAAKMENLKTTIGNMLLPVLQELMVVAQPLLEFVQANITWIAPLVGAIAGLAAGIKIWTAAQWLLNIALDANPIGIVIVAVAALTAAFIYLYQNVEWFHDFINKNWPILVGLMLGGLPAIAAAIYVYWDEIVQFTQWMIDSIIGILSNIYDVITWPFRVAIDAVVSFFGALPGRIQGALGSAWSIITAPFVTAFDWVMQQGAKIGDWFYRLPGTVQGYLSSLFNIITYPFRTAFDSIVNAAKGVGDWFYRLPGQINQWLSNIGNIIKYPFEQAFNAIKTLWNNTIGRINFTIPSWVPGIGGRGWQAPRLAEGGIVNRPTLALIGEAGPEAVIPLNRLSTNSPAQPVIINVYALTASAEVGRQVYQALQEYERISGRRFGT
jgi:hypothetical protein